MADKAHMVDKLKTFDLIPVNSLGRSFKMRHVRNQVSEFLTHNTEYITWFQQVVWYLTVYKPSHSMRAYLVVTPDGDAIGYGLVSLRDGQWNVTGALLESYRGQGIGRTLFKYLTQNALLSSGKDVYLDVRTTNIPALKLYASLGYQPYAIDAENGVIKMKWSGTMAEA